MSCRSRDIFKLGHDHTIRLSAEYRHSSLATTPLSGATVFYDVFSGGAMWNWAIEPNLSLTNAVRLDSLSLGRSGVILPGFGLTNAAWDGRSLTAISFNSGLVWQPDPDNTLRATLARGVQLPNLLDLGGLLIAAPPFGYVSGVPTLDPTIVMNYELAWDRKLPQWHATLRVRLFHQTTRDIAANTGGTLYPLGIVATPANIGRSKASGLEILLDGTFGEDWRWGLSYTPEIRLRQFRAGLQCRDRAGRLRAHPSRAHGEGQSGLGTRPLGDRWLSALPVGDSTASAAPAASCPSPRWCAFPIM